MNVNDVPTPMMGTVGLDWLGIQSTIDHVLSLLESQGDAAVGIVRNILKLVAAVTGRDMLLVFRLANELYVDVAALIAAIRTEFDL